MNILIISPLVPYPLTDGGRMGVFYPIKYLSGRGNSIHLVCLSEEYNPQGIDYLKNHCKLEIIPHSKKPTFRGAFYSLFSDIPYEIKRFHSKYVLEFVKHILATNTYDIIQVEGIHTAFYGLEIKKEWDIPVVMRAHNIHSMNLHRFIPRLKNPLLKLYLSIEANKVKKYEITASQKYDRVLTVSEVDKQLLHSWNEKIRCDVVEAGVDVEKYSLEYNDEEKNTILWMGALQWKPNQDSLLWFIQDILPGIIRKKPEVKVSVVGSNPPKKISRLRHPNVEIVGTVDDVKPYLKRTEVCVVPLRIGSGIRLKILEMLSMGKAVVSTSVGCEGLPVIHGEHLLIADEPDKFADAVLKLLNSRDMRRELGDNGHELVKDQYSWSRISEKLEQIYLEIIDERKGIRT